MNLQRLTIRRNYDGNLVGELELAGETGKVALAVNEALCQRIVEVCADALVDVAKSVARDMTAELITATKAKAIA
jgi:hypothetical protein